MSYLTFPAISVFVLLGASIFSAARIRGITRQDQVAIADAEAVNEAVKLWWARHKSAAWFLFAATIALMIFGATWMVFLFYILSFGVLLYVLSSYRRFGLGSRQSIGGSCMMGLMFLGQLAVSIDFSGNDIHFIDQKIIGVIFILGALSVLAISWDGKRIVPMGRWGLIVFPAIVLALSAWLLNPILWPTTEPRIKAHVESFHEAWFSTSSWREWEIPARWAIESKLDPDLSGARRLLDREIAGEQNPFIIANAFRVGLVRADEIGRLKSYESRRKLLLDDPYHLQESQPIISLAQEDWVIRASVLNGSLTDRDRDFLAKRLLANLGALNTDPYAVLGEALEATQLLALIGRPVDVDRYRPQVHALLGKFASRSGGGFQLAGGFKQYLNLWTGSADATEYAIELMETYGVPADLDLNWVRSFVRPSVNRFSDKWILAVARHRLDRLPGAMPPGWLEILYHERSLLAAVVLVGLCFYATLASPRLKAV